MNKPYDTERSLVIIGGGGHASVVIEALRASGQYEPVAIVERSAKEGQVLGIPICGDDSELPRLASLGVRYYIVAVGSTGSAKLREHLHVLAKGCGLTPATVVHPTAVIADSAVLGLGAYVAALAHIGARTVIGDGVIVNSCASIDHDCVLGAFVHVAPGAVVCGGVSIDRGAHVGPGAVLVSSISIGKNAVVGAGSTVVRDVSPNTVVWGNPAREPRTAAQQ